MFQFKDCTLWISGRSPFARRVRIAFQESGLPFSVRVENVWEPKPELLALNPLGRVPFVQFKNSSEILIDSNIILEEFYDYQKITLHRHPEARFVSAVAIGLIEKTIEYFLEFSRSKEQHDQDWLKEIHGVVERSLTILEKKLSGKDHLLSEGFCQADWDVGSALGYLEFRYSQTILDRFPGVKKYYEKISARESFKISKPS